MQLERAYTVGMVVLLVFETMLSIPLMIDSLLGDSAIQMVFIVAVCHILMWMFGTGYHLNHHNSKVHLIGMLAFIGSFVPIAGFVFHLLVVWVLLKYFVSLKRQKA